MRRARPYRGENPEPGKDVTESWGLGSSGGRATDSLAQQDRDQDQDQDQDDDDQAVADQDQDQDQDQDDSDFGGDDTDNA